MTSLQTTLLILAVTFIVIVLIYNFIQARNANKRIARSREGMGEAMAEVVSQSKHSEGPTSLGAGFGVPDSKDGPLVNLQLAKSAALADQQGPVLERFNLPGLEPSESVVHAHSQADHFSNAELGSNDSGGVGSKTSFTVEANAKTAASSQNSAEKILGSNGLISDSKTTSSSATATPQPLGHSPVGDAWMFRSFGLHPKADCIVQWHLPEPLSGEKLLSLTGGLRRVGSKPVMFEGQSSQLDLNDVWEPLVAGERFMAVRMGVLMANRHGALNAMEFSDFAAFAEKLAAQFQVHIELPDMQQTLQRARALDSQCADLDAQVALNVIAAESLTVEDLTAIALELGLSERGNNRYAMLAEHGEVLYSLALGDAPNRLTLLLDVPRSPSAAMPWLRMVDTAQRCAARFAGRLVDDFDKPLNKDAIERIGIQIAQRYQSLSDASLDAGSPVALRLFN
jgi:ZipA, C-terminal FtsZ-binding domain